MVRHFLTKFSALPCSDNTCPERSLEVFRDHPDPILKLIKSIRSGLRQLNAPRPIKEKTPASKIINPDHLAIFKVNFSCHLIIQFHIKR